MVNTDYLMNLKGKLQHSKDSALNNTIHMNKKYIYNTTIKYTINANKKQTYNTITKNIHKNN